MSRFKGKVERLVQFVKDNFLAGRVFYHVTDLNWQALEWRNRQNGTYHRAMDGEPQQIRRTVCGEQLHGTHDVTWIHMGNFCEVQYEALIQPEEIPTTSVQTQIRQPSKLSDNLSFAKFNFDGEEPI